MKRQQDRDSPVKGKRSHSSVSRYDDSPRERGTPDRRDRRGSNKSPNDQRRGRTRDSSPERGMAVSRSGNVIGRDVYDNYSRNVKCDRGSPYNYKILCVTNFNHKVSDAAIRDVLLREFNRFGDVSVKVCHDSNERLAYVYFQSCDDARDARRSKPRLVLFDKPAQVEPVVDRGVSGRRNKSLSPEFIPPNVRSVSPAHSSTSTNSMGRRPVGGRQNSLERSALPPFPTRESLRRDAHCDFHHHPHRREESKKEKFPNYLHHVPPEEDDKATRTLFVGNLEVTISEAELRRIFERYGIVEDIDVKRPPPGQGNAYAFIKFLNLDMAHRAKVEMSGQYIGKFQCKIGYGKATPTTRIWVGGLGPWTSLSHLEREFDRFGAIRKIDFVKGENHAYIQYDSIDAAQAACQEMRGFPLGGPDKRLRVDFADPGPYSYYQSPTRGMYQEEDPYGPRRSVAHSDLAAQAEYYSLESQWPRNSSFHNSQPYDYDRPSRSQNRDQWQALEHDDRVADYHGWTHNHQQWWDDHSRGNRNDGERRKRPRTPDDDLNIRTGREDGGVPYKLLRRSRTPDRNEPDKNSSGKDANSPRRGRNEDSGNRKSSKDGALNSESSQRNDVRNSNRNADHDGKEEDGASGRTRKIESSDDKKKQNLMQESGVTVAESVTNLQDLAKCCPVAWHGGLILKNSAFPTRMHVCSGDPSLVDNLMKEANNEVPMLRITQRLRLDPTKLEDVSRKITTIGAHAYCMLLTLPGSVQPSDDQCNSVQQRPLRNLVSYLKQKEAAGVVSLPSSGSKKDGKEGGVLYAFPPCSFALDLLRRIAPNLTGESSKDEHLVVVVVKGS